MSIQSSTPSRVVHIADISLPGIDISTANTQTLFTAPFAGLYHTSLAYTNLASGAGNYTVSLSNNIRGQKVDSTSSKAAANTTLWQDFLLIYAEKDEVVSAKFKGQAGDTGITINGDVVLAN